MAAFSFRSAARGDVNSDLNHRTYVVSVVGDDES
jgi:hypothetical protein